MKIIEGFKERDRCARSVFSHNGLSYELIPEYGNFPNEFEFSMYSGGCCDKEDNLFLMCRDTEHPVVMLLYLRFTSDKCSISGLAEYCSIPIHPLPPHISVCYTSCKFHSLVWSFYAFCL